MEGSEAKEIVRNTLRSDAYWFFKMNEGQEKIGSIFNLWTGFIYNGKKLRQPKPNSKTTKNAIKIIKQVLRGQHNRIPKLTTDDINDILFKHFEEALVPGYEPHGSFKEKLRGLSIEEFFWNDWCDENSPLKSRCLYLLENEPKIRNQPEKIIDSNYPEEVSDLKSMPYDAYLETDYWKMLRKKVLKKAQFRCQLCNKREQLHCHHRSYKYRGEGEKELEDLIVLCENCHEKFHDIQQEEYIPKEKYTRREKFSKTSFNCECYDDEFRLYEYGDSVKEKLKVALPSGGKGPGRLWHLHRDKDGEIDWWATLSCKITKATFNVLLIQERIKQEIEKIEEIDKNETERNKNSRAE